MQVLSFDITMDHSFCPSGLQRNLKSSRRWNKNANVDKSIRSTWTQYCSMPVTSENIIVPSCPRWWSLTELWWAITPLQTERRRRKRRGLRKREWGDLWYVFVWSVFNPLTPMSDQDRISPYNINTISSIEEMRI